MACSHCAAPWRASLPSAVSSELLNSSRTRRCRAYTSAPLRQSFSDLLGPGTGVVAPQQDRRRLVVLAAKKKGAPVNKAAAAKKEKEAAEAAAAAAKNAAPYTNPDVFMHSLLLIDSYRRATGKPLFTDLELPDSGRALFEAPFVCMSHDGEEDPVFDYGNKAALELFEMTWDEFTKMPSRKSAASDAPEQEGRNQLLAEALEKGAIELHDAQRYTSTGKPFIIQKGVLWTITNLEGERLGQAAVCTEIEHPAASASADSKQTLPTAQALDGTTSNGPTVVS
ncbi:hypothetical protein KFL_005900030 [Klebsormidium nitens]|uniref:MEKHLA domain-containing protein n=1 Tax=Klebsormidium nitens TaxID=105231 RepID=A0A1Y1IN27_KLENI|nr:hypothetical protein KFL_005900030 [Klebsormidium nitens]|eukprot:GAQ90017.1 hypothetical protein KFL_005900030 [Klebsormidium nitens]